MHDIRHNAEVLRRSSACPRKSNHEPLQTLLFELKADTHAKQKVCLMASESNCSRLNIIRVQLPRSTEHDLPLGVTPSKLNRCQQSANTFYGRTLQEGQQVLT